jgi:hypothetical protein
MVIKLRECHEYILKLLHATINYGFQKPSVGINEEKKRKKNKC